MLGTKLDSMLAQTLPPVKNAMHVVALVSSKLWWAIGLSREQAHVHNVESTPCHQLGHGTVWVEGHSLRPGQHTPPPQPPFDGGGPPDSCKLPRGRQSSNAGDLISLLISLIR